MDEIVIEDKKYISTKRAAKVTGYAKDYVGQLCREGRVPARLVGRSWYVLESALADHRFGNEEEPVQAEKQEEKSEYPKYQADEIEAIETFSAERIVVQTEEKEEKPERETIKDAWEAWFDRVANAAVHSTPKVEEVAEEEPEAQLHISREETIAIHTVVEGTSQKEIEGLQEAVPVHITHKKHSMPQKLPRASKSSTAPSMLISAKIGGGLLSLFFLVAFVFSTGIFDNKLISSERDSFIAGITVYKK